MAQVKRWSWCAALMVCAQIHAAFGQTTATQPVRLIKSGEEDRLIQIWQEQEQITQECIERVKAVVKKHVPQAEIKEEISGHISLMYQCEQVTELWRVKKTGQKLGGTCPWVPRSRKGFHFRRHLSYPINEGQHWEEDILKYSHHQGAVVSSSLGPKITKDWLTSITLHSPKGAPLRLRLEMNYGRDVSPELLRDIHAAFHDVTKKWGSALEVEDPLAAYRIWAPRLDQRKLRNINGPFSARAYTKKEVLTFGSAYSMANFKEAVIYYEHADLNNDGILDYAISDTQNPGNMGLDESDSCWMIFLGRGDGRFVFIYSILLNPGFTIKPLAPGKSQLHVLSQYRRTTCNLYYEIDGDSVRLVKRDDYEHPRADR